MPGKPPYGWEEQLSIRDEIESTLEQQGWRSLGAGYGFGVADVLLVREKEGMVVHLQAFVGSSDVEFTVEVMERDDEDV